MIGSSLKITLIQINKTFNILWALQDIAIFITNILPRMVVVQVDNLIRGEAKSYQENRIDPNIGRPQL